MTDQIGRVLGDRYRLVAPIGTGASAQVFLAEDISLKREVAVKLLHEGLVDDPRFLERFRAEAQATASLNHQHLVAVHDWGFDDVPYLVTEYLAGGSLQQIFDQGYRLTNSQVLLVGLEASRALEYAHRRGLIHRDIKPSNLLFDADGRLRIADFGLARALAEAALTEPMDPIIGTARYAAPEQARGQVVDGKADVYSLALVLIEGASGQVPFTTDTTVGTLMARVDKPLPVPESLGILRGPIQRSGHTEPHDRPDAGELAVALMAAAESLPRPEPLPLVGALVPTGFDPDPTDLGLVATPTPAPEPTPGGSRRRATEAQHETVEDEDDLYDPRYGSGEHQADVLPVAPREDDFDALTPIEFDPVDSDDRDASAESGFERTVSFDPSELPPDEFEPKTMALPKIVVPDDEADDTAGVARRRPVETVEPGRGNPIAWAFTGLILVGGIVIGSWLYWRSAGTPVHLVPDLIGTEYEDLGGLIGDNGWEVTRLEGRADGSELDSIIVQVPEPGVELAEGEELRVTVSLGNEMVPIPALGTDLTEEDAEVRLGAFGLEVGAVSGEPNEDVPVGQIVRVDEPVLEVPRGEAIDLVISAGPGPRIVPAELDRMVAADAVTAIEALRLNASVVREFDPIIAEGLVVAVDPPIGSEVEVGTAIILTVSDGPAPIAVPDVTGYRLADAVEVLETAGLCIGETDGPANERVKVTDPAAGEFVPVSDDCDDPLAVPIVLVTEEADETEDG